MRLRQLGEFPDDRFESESAEIARVKVVIEMIITSCFTRRAARFEKLNSVRRARTSLNLNYRIKQRALMPLSSIHLEAKRTFIIFS